MEGEEARKQHHPSKSGRKAEKKRLQKDKKHGNTATLQDMKGKNPKVELRTKEDPISLSLPLLSKRNLCF
jgi:hypothetical protein